MWEGVDIHKICKPAACSFMKKLTHLQRFRFFFFFLTAIWLPHGRFGTFLRRQSYSPDLNHLCFIYSTRRSPRTSFGSLSSAKHLVRFEPGLFRFWSQRLNPPGHSPRRANSVKVNILKNSLECLHMIFVSFFFFFSAATLQYEQLKIFIFSNESYNEEQEIGSIILPTSTFFSVRLMKKIVLNLLH